jgi:hypothetical protein
MTQNQVRVENVWNVDAAAAVTTTILGLIAAVFDGWITTNYSLLISSSCTFDQLVCTDQSVANGAQVILIPTTTNGANGTAQAAGNASLVASLRTAKTGKNFRGRTYIPALANNFLTDAQHVSVGVAAVANAHFVGLLTLLTSAGYKLCVLSRFLNNALRAVGLLTEIISIVTDTKVDSQQRRTAN